MEAIQYHFDTVALALRVLVDSIKGIPASEPWRMWPHHLQERVDNFQFPALTELLYPALVCCFILSAIRFVLQYFVFRRLAIFSRDIKEVKFTPDKTLNAFMTKKNKITKENIGNISRVTGKSESAIKEYVRLKRKADCNEKKITKFIEALWRTIFYSVFVVVGMRTLLFPDVASWVLDGRELCIGWPEEHVASEAVLQYYYIELGAYFHQLLWTEVSRSDSVEMIAHHLITIALLVLSHAANFNRYGSMLLILHDISDVFLESAKCFNYVSQVPRWKHFHIACDVLFGGFVITFFVCRLVLFPKVFLVNSFAYCVHEYFGFHFYFAPLILSLLFLLFCLHIFWFYLTIKMIFRLLSPEGITKDERSDDEDGSDDELSGDDNSGAKKQAPIARKKTKKDN